MSAPDLRARSPWAALQGVERAELSPPPNPINASLAIPGSKSLTNRALIIAAAAQGPSELRGLLRSDDSYWCVESLKSLGIAVKVTDDQATIAGCNANWPNCDATVYVGAAGTLARFLPGVLAASSSGHWRVEGSKRMSERPIRELVNGLRELGGSIKYAEKPDCYPLEIFGRGLAGGEVAVSGKISSQFLSGLLIASPLAHRPVTIRVIDGIVQHSYVDLTVSLMRQFGAEVDHDDSLTKFTVQPTRYLGANLELEADASTSCYFLALAALTGGDVTITNLSPRTSQPDIELVDYLERMGAMVIRGTSTITVRGMGALHGGFEANLREFSDQALTLAAIAVYADAPIRISGVAHIRHHESDRVHCMFEALSSLGIRVDEHEDGLTVYPGAPTPAVLKSYDDHRMAMSLSLIASRATGISILDPGCVSKTCPAFFEQIKNLGYGVKLCPGA